MKRSDRLDKIAALNAGFENMASRNLASASGQYEQQRQQLERLKGYQQEYQQGLSQKMRGAVSSNEIRQYRAFLLSLEKAIAQQSATVAKSHRHMESAREEWQCKHREVKKMEKAAENIRGRETLQRQLRELKEMDERNQYGRRGGVS